MISVKNLIKEYNNRKGLCSHCEYNNLDGGRCYNCKNGNWFVDVSSLKEYIGDRIAEDTRKDFLDSESGIRLKTVMEIREGLYRDFSNYVNAQKATLDKLLKEYCEAYNAAKSNFEDAMKACMVIQVHKALEELDGGQA